MAETLPGIKVAIDNLQNSNALVLYKVGPVLVCSPALPVESITIPPDLNNFPGTNNAEPGVFKSMHGMVRVVDLRVRFGVDSADRKSPGRIIISEVTGGYAGFWVDEIEDVIAFPEKGWSQLPALVPREVFSRALIRDEGIRLYADLENLDKFKATGYLRSHIESIKSAKVERETKKTNKHKNKVVAPSTFNKEHDNKTSSEVHADKSDVKKPIKLFDEHGANRATVSYLNDNKSRQESVSSKILLGVSNRRPEVVKSRPLPSLKQTQHKSNNVSALGKANPESVTRDYAARKVMAKNDSKNYFAANSQSSGHASSKTITPVVKESSGDMIWVSILVLGFLATSIYLIEFSGFIERGLEGSSGAQISDKSTSRKLNETAYQVESKETASYSGDTVDITKTDEGIVIVINDYETETVNAALENVESAESEFDLNEAGLVSDSNELVFDTEDGVLAFKGNDIELNNEAVSDAQVKEPVENISSEIVIENKKPNVYAVDKSIVAESMPVKTFKNIHIVVEGDTLWHISERYVNDPWKYPELARLSKIKDPDLIYPGQKVIIIYNTNK